MDRTEMRITGFGGQGVVLSAHIIGCACSVHADKNATMIQSFGPEARGSSCSATLVIRDTEVLYPYVQELDFLVVMSAEGYEKYLDELKDGGVLIYESDLVRPTFQEGQKAFGIPSTRIAESLGRRIVQNIVMLGFLTAVTRIVPVEKMRDAVKASVPVGTEEMNLKAFDAGWDHFETEYAKKKVHGNKARLKPEKTPVGSGAV